MHRKFRYSNKSHQLLKNNGKHNFALTHALTIYPSNTVYTFIPKIACSTMRYSVAYANGCVHNLDDISWIHKNNHTFSADLATAIKADYTFTILRCPFDRILSAFMDKIVGIDIEAWYYCMSEGRTMLPYDVTFDSFVRDLSVAPANALNIHWRPQVNFLVYKEYDEVFSLSDFDSAKQTLKDKIGFEVFDTRGAIGHDATRLSEVESIFNPEKMPALDLLALKEKGLMPKKLKFFTEENIELLSKIYKDDIIEYVNLFGISETMSKLRVS